jgi:hypothetical protein
LKATYPELIVAVGALFVLLEARNLPHALLANGAPSAMRIRGLGVLGFGFDVVRKGEEGPGLVVSSVVHYTNLVLAGEFSRI